MLICRGLNKNDTITTLDEWFVKCPPKQGNWVDGRSAKELARLWTSNRGSDVVAALEKALNSCPDTRNITFGIASPEFESAFDPYPNGRVHDLLIVGQQGSQSVVIGVEAKVDEGFGNKTVGEALEDGTANENAGQKTDVPKRVSTLLTALAPRSATERLLQVRYQLAYAAAGILSEAKRRRAAKAILLVHNLMTLALSAEKYAKNQRDLDYFVDVLSSSRWSNITSGQVVGPVHLPGNQFIPGDVPLYFGKVETVV